MPAEIPSNVLLRFAIVPLASTSVFRSIDSSEDMESTMSLIPSLSLLADLYAEVLSSSIPLLIPSTSISPAQAIFLEGEWIPKKFLMPFQMFEQNPFTLSVIQFLRDWIPFQSPLTRFFPISPICEGNEPKAFRMADMICGMFDTIPLMISGRFDISAVKIVIPASMNLSMLLMMKFDVAFKLRCQSKKDALYRAFALDRELMLDVDIHESNLEVRVLKDFRYDVPHGCPHIE